MIKGVVQQPRPTGVAWNRVCVESAGCVCLRRHGQRGEGGVVDLAAWVEWAAWIHGWWHSRRGIVYN